MLCTCPRLNRAVLVAIRDVPLAMCRYGLVWFEDHKTADYKTDEIPTWIASEFLLLGPLRRRCWVTPSNSFSAV